MGYVMKFLKSNKFLFFFFVLTGCFVSMFLKREVLWDFANYHYYNPWALVNGRLWEDVGLGGYQAFFNPLADLPLYYLIQYFNAYPNLICFLQGIPFGALLFVSFLLFRQYFDEQTWRGRFCILMALLIVSTGFAVNSQIGSSSNDITVSVLILWGFYLLQKEIFLIDNPRNIIFFFSGALMGSAMGLKLTCIIYCAGIAGLLIIYLIKSKFSFKNFLCFAAGGVSGFLIFHGYWMFLLWQNFENPFFPFANAWFKSEWLPEINFRDMRFLPKNWYEYLFLPFIWTFGNFHFLDNMIVTDIRLSLCWLLAFAYVVFVIKNKIKKIYLNHSSLHQAWLFMVGFCILSYLCWLFAFAILRYCVVLEVFGALFFVQAAVFLKPKKQKFDILYFSALNIFIFALLTTPIYSNDWGKRKNTNDMLGVLSSQSDQTIYSPMNLYAQYNQFVSVENLNIPDGTVVLFGGLPNAFVLPFLAENAKVKAIGVVNENYNMTPDVRFNGSLNKGKWKEAKDKIIKKYGKPDLFIVTMMASMDLKEVIPSQYLKNIMCRPLKNNVLSRLFVCATPEKLNEYKSVNKRETCDE